MVKNRVVVAMSGGVDSSVCAYLLKKHGYDVIGLSMQIWQDVDVESNSIDAINDARNVAKNIGIPYYVVNLKDYFDEKVVENFISEYLLGRTPNPCVACNRYLKFGALLKKTMELDAFYLATGHYARVDYSYKYERYILKKAKDDAKDQSYALYNLTQMQLEHILLPLGNLTKDEIRDIAKDADLPVAEKPDSQEICFIDSNYKEFLKQKVPDKIKPGFFIDKKGNILGKHLGIPFYTIGQRKGLGISADKPLYVIQINADDNTIVLGENAELLRESFIAKDLNWIAISKLDYPLDVAAKIRYNFSEKPAKIVPKGNDLIKVIFKEPQRAITPGQSVVFYKDDVVIGGGIIKE